MSRAKQIRSRRRTRGNPHVRFCRRAGAGNCARLASASSRYASDPTVDAVDAIEPRLELTDQPDPDLARFLEDQIYDVNAARTGVRDGRLLGIGVRDGAGALVAGLYGWTWAGWLEVRALWVHDAWRGRGLGRRLLAAAEREAIARGCRWSLLDTHTFQAPGFYRRLGYIEVASITDYPPGYQRHYLRKHLG